MERKRSISRREFLKATALATAGTALAACTKTTATPVPPQPTATQPAVVATKPLVVATNTPLPPVAKFKEAPMLTTLVNNGVLPPVDERLPENPWVAPCLESIGTHGGTARRGFKGVSDRWGPTKLRDRGLVWWDKTLVMRPRVAESWTVNADGTEWTFTLRKGTKWSDGVEYTTENVQWWYDHVVTNTTLFPSVEGNWKTGVGADMQTMQLIVKDAYTFTLKYAHPNPLIINKIGRADIGCPSHYMKYWHIDTCDDKDILNQKVRDAGFNSWNQYYLDNRRWWYANPDLPQYGGWLAKNDLSKELFVIERNPYFPGVDEQGNQLPYWDRITHRLMESVETFNLWIVNGEIDYQARFVDIGNYTLFKENEAKGDYKVVMGVSAQHLVVMPNQSTKNEKLRTFFQNRNVRIAMSYAIDREQINELVYNGLAKPRQYSPLAMSALYYEKLSNAYLDYNVAEANKLLDEAGYSAKDSDGFRKYPDGETINFTIEGQDASGSPAEDAIQQIVKMFTAVGIKCAYKYVERSLYEQHYNANEIEAAWWFADRTVAPLAADALIFRGVARDRPFILAYGMWNGDPTYPEAVEPPADHYSRKLWDLWAKIGTEADPEKQKEYFWQMLDVWAEELPMIGVLGEMPSMCIIKNGIKNFVAGFPNDDTTGDENVYNTETYSWDDPSKHL